MGLKLFVLAAMLLGESVCIYSEMLVAKTNSLVWPLILITVAGFPLLAAYYYGYRAFGDNMWPVMVVSMGAVLVSEPALIWWMFKTLPSKQTLVGMAFGVAGLLIVMTERD